jgi:CO/xanthine dehydrogenase FAD-binding subunit
MHVPDVELHQVTTLDEAAALMARHAPDARLLAGGTDLLVDLKTGRVSVRHLVSLKGLDEIRGVSETEAGLRIGALTTITDLERSALVRLKYAPILDAASQMAARQIRNMATAGGNVSCAVPCADLPPILIAMNGTVRLWSPGSEREVPLDGFYAGPRQTVRRDDEVLTSIQVPKPPPGFGAAYVRFAQRDGNAIAVAAVAASLQLDGDGTVQAGRVVLNAVAPTPRLVREAGDGLIGRPADAEAFRAAAIAAREAAEPISDARGSAEFRRELVEVLARRALGRALERTSEVRA